MFRENYVFFLPFFFFFFFIFDWKAFTFNNSQVKWEWKKRKTGSIKEIHQIGITSKKGVQTITTQKLKILLYFRSLHNIYILSSTIHFRWIFICEYLLCLCLCTYGDTISFDVEHFCVVNVNFYSVFNDEKLETREAT